METCEKVRIMKKKYISLLKGINKSGRIEIDMDENFHDMGSFVRMLRQNGNYRIKRKLIIEIKPKTWQ
jgi:hypothetical protein